MGKGQKRTTEWKAGTDRPAKVGRPATGKRSNPDYRQVSAWIRRDTYDAVSIKLIKEGRTEFSELVQTLLEQWLKTKPKERA